MIHLWFSYVCVLVDVRPPHLSKEGHSEVGAQQPLACVHHLHHFGVGTVEGVVQVRQFLFHRNAKIADIFTTINQEAKRNNM